MVYECQANNVRHRYVLKNIKYSKYKDLWKTGTGLYVVAYELNESHANYMEINM